MDTGLRQYDGANRAFGNEPLGTREVNLTVPGGNLTLNRGGYIRP